jgi:phage tail sheath gpL-like
MGSNAVSTSAVSRIVGYVLNKGNFATSSPNLPQSIAILSEANDANQATMSTEGTLITSAQQAGQLYGYGSPIYGIMRILLPLQGGGISGIPITVFAQEKAVGSTSKIIEITPSGVATADGTHTLVIAGREGLDAVFYDLNIRLGDSTAEITAYIEDAVNAVLGAPVIGSSTDYEAALETKWSGLTANELSVTVDTGNDDLGITYDIATTQAGSGTPSISDALSQFGSTWYTLVINGYSTNSNIMSALESFNGIPNPTNPTGRYTGIIMKPFIALTGSVADDPSSITDSHLNNVTIAICPAPLSSGFTFEAAANVCAMCAPQMQDSPQLDIAGQSYPDMPAISQQLWGTAAMSAYNNRDAIVKKGCSTVDLIAGVYVMQDFVTTYHPLGETPPQFRYVRNLTIDFNIRFGYYLLEQAFVMNHVIAKDTDIVNSGNVVKPKDWKGDLFTYAEDLTKRSLITDTAFMEKSIVVNISTVNPDRFETEFSYKRSGFARIAATTATAGFNFGNN